MTFFEGASEFVIHGGQFTNVYNLGPHGDSGQIVRGLVEKDSSLNQYSIEHNTATIPRFSKSLLLQDLQVDLNVGRMNTGSCSFDLLTRLGLFPGQPNEALAEYDTKIPLEAVVSHGNCYCGRISRHGFLFLVSKYFQHVSVAEAMTGGTCFILSTTIGRFKCYEIDDRTFVHFDSSTRSSHVDLVKDQNLDDILRIARGEYQFSGGVSPNDADNVFKWHRNMGPGQSLESIATGQFYGVPNAVIYMTKATLQRWKRIKEFAFVMLDTVLSVLDGVEEPAKFVSAVKNFIPPVDDGMQSDGLETSTPPEDLALSIYLLRTLSRKRISTMSYERFQPLSVMFLTDMFEAHKYFHHPRVPEFRRHMDSSHKRFLHILDGFPTVDDSNSAGRVGELHIQQELRGILHKNKDNVALVAMQGFFALLSQWNASRILLNAREAPEEWIRFVGAEDDDFFMG